MRPTRLLLPALGGALAAGLVWAALVVPTDVQLPGTQPLEVTNLETPDKCDNCHGGYDPVREPSRTWAGSMMAQAGRDPLFWASVAIAEQDFDGSGDLCIRCHSPDGWLAGRSTPTNGAGLLATDAHGVSCDFCHKLTRPDGSEHVGVQAAPFFAHDEGTPKVPYIGAGQYVLWGGSEKLGPYATSDARHQFMRSNYHRSSDLCGTCHDVSNPVVGDLAPGNGAPVPLDAGTFSGVPGTAVAGKAAFNNAPHAYGVVERTYSEHRASLLSQTRVSSYASLPPELKAGAIKAAYDSAIVAGRNGDYEDGTPRLFSCQSCHMRPVTGQGCNKNPPVRADLPLHDMVGGNTWVPDAIKWQDARGLLRLGGGLTATQLAALDEGKAKAGVMLSQAAALSLSGNQVQVVNLTGHKLISGYPEGRRLWLNVKWLTQSGAVLREDGRYGDLAVVHDGTARVVRTLLDPADPNTRVYDAHGAITQPWAAKLVSLGVPGTLPLGYDRVSGAVTSTLGQLAAEAPTSSRETFHFVLNNHVARDTRIPPYGMSYDEARRRNTLPVPASQYGAPGAGGRFLHYDTVTLQPPAGAVRAELRLLYQTTSWEYVQFLARANRGQDPFLGQEGRNLFDAWAGTGMAEPVVMASAVWTAPVSDGGTGGGAGGGGGSSVDAGTGGGSGGGGGGTVDAGTGGGSGGGGGSSVDAGTGGGSGGGGGSSVDAGAGGGSGGIDAGTGGGCGCSTAVGAELTFAVLALLTARRRRPRSVWT